MGWVGWGREIPGNSPRHPPKAGCVLWMVAQRKAKTHLYIPCPFLVSLVASGKKVLSLGLASARAALGLRPELCRAPRPDTHIFHLFSHVLEPSLSNTDVASSAYSHSSLASPPSLKATATHLASPG